MNKWTKKAPTLVLVALVSVGFALAPETSQAQADLATLHAERATEMILGLDLDDARKELAGESDSSPSIAVAKARLALYEEDCDGSAAILARADLAHDENASGLLDIARGCARVTAATVVDRDPAHAVEIRYQDEGDRALTPLLVETVVKARDVLTHDLGVTWPTPTRIVVVRDLLSLSAMTGLPYDSAKTTGTVAVAKWGRVTLLSPRASHHGYEWRDTMNHELTHLAVTRATVDRAPLWLQEGVAKREEIRWRAPGPFDDRPTPESIVTRGIAEKIDIPLDKLGPSIAMLKSADAAQVAFAEVTSFVRFYADTGGPDALPKLLAALRKKEGTDVALRESSGTDFKGWDTRWRAMLASRPNEPLPSVIEIGPRESDPVIARDLAERVRLAELLLGRDHAKEALLEIDGARGLHMSGMSSDASETADPSVRATRGRILEALGRKDDAWPEVSDVASVAAPYAPWWALRGRLLDARGDTAGADSAYVDAVAADPFEVAAACEAVDPTAPIPPSYPADAKLLCEAARAAGEPSMGRD